MMRTRKATTTLMTSLLAVVLATPTLHGEDSSAKLAGTWVQVIATQNNRVLKPRGNERKILQVIPGGAFNRITYSTVTGEVVQVAGGQFKIDAANYVEDVKFRSEGITAVRKGKLVTTYEWTLRADGGSLLLSAFGGRYTEVWKRAQ